MEERPRGKSRANRKIAQPAESSQPIVHKNVLNTYQKGSLWCVYAEDELVYKYHIVNIRRIVESYGYHGRNNGP